MKSQDIRASFLAFFKDKMHAIVPSAPMVLKTDPTLMFVNAGMAPFKDYFLGNATPQNTRIANTQKCLRVSGKHNDLEDVGQDTYHHTFFEMLGNWSFGDYFKEEAIAWAWELLTDVYNIEKEALYVTVFGGSRDADNLPLDADTYGLWKRFVPESHIIKASKKDNFWEMGSQGPCGPCSEIHIDIRCSEERAKVAGRDLINKNHPQVLEIWNLVFMQYHRNANGTLEVLPERHIDTGMGLERLCMVLQGVQSNYDTDVFGPIIKGIATATNKCYGKDQKVDVAIRVISDHLRAVAFSIAEGQLPSNTGAGYVIRRILRRAIRYGFTFLDKKEPFIYTLVDGFIEGMAMAFPELDAQKHLIERVIREEEFSFLKTLDQGLGLLHLAMAENPVGSLPGEKVFELYDTYGFPVDLTALILRENGRDLDNVGFKKALEAQKKRSRAANQMCTDDWVVVANGYEGSFVGYDTLEACVKIVRYRSFSSKKQGRLYQLVFDKTPFYAEGGGQVGDRGVIEDAEGCTIRILDTKKENGTIVHVCKSLPRDIGGTLKVLVDGVQRRRIESNHSATHLLHRALREVLGTHVEQRGSAVSSESLRFDFSHFSKLTPDELQRVERVVNGCIADGIPLVEMRDVPREIATKEGAIGLFGETYGPVVRTIRFKNSFELCGGTHVKNTADIWHFKIVSESAVAAGIRRIEAITNDAARAFYIETNCSYNRIRAALNNAQDPVKALLRLQNENVLLKKQLEVLLSEKATMVRTTLEGALVKSGDFLFLARLVDLDAASAKNVAFELGRQFDNLFLVLATKRDEGVGLLCYISKALVASKGLNAGEVVRGLAKHIRGSGGGQAFFATAGGSYLPGVTAAFKAAECYVKGLAPC